MSRANFHGPKDVGVNLKFESVFPIRCWALFSGHENNETIFMVDTVRC